MTERAPSSVTFTLDVPAETPWLGVFSGTAVPVVCLAGTLVLLLMR